VTKRSPHKKENSFRENLGSNSPEVLPYKGFRSEKLAIEAKNAKISEQSAAIAAYYLVIGEEPDGSYN